MKYIRILLIGLSFIVYRLQGTGQLTIQIYGLPASTIENPSLFIAGNFNGWDPGDPGYLLQEKDGVYSLTLMLAAPFDLEFKFTQGSWGMTEGNEDGSFLPNRKYAYRGGPDTLRLEIAEWEKRGPAPPSTTTPNVRIPAVDLEMPQLGRERRVWICLPNDYENSKQRYPVLYMHDGQNLFDAANSFAGEWRVDETLDEWKGKGFIVVGIEHGGGYRLDEYSPWTNPKYGGGQGDEYAAFIAETLKPWIDDNYRTLKGRRHTGIMGSSMGGLISLFTAVEYQQTFGFAGIFSPSLWFSDQWATHIRQTGKKRPVKFYILAGKEESETMEQEAQSLAQALRKAGFSPAHIAVRLDDDGAHAEWYWAREFPKVVHWWLK